MSQPAHLKRSQSFPSFESRFELAIKAKELSFKISPQSTGLELQTNSHSRPLSTYPSEKVDGKRVKKAIDKTSFQKRGLPVASLSPTRVNRFNSVGCGLSLIVIACAIAVGSVVFAFFQD